ncbi:hypothetical protein NLJ89_g11373 [Agrocybe chaxingu]|uniref:BTB domain-containing protein n=1 Tax=Agrocybe chaxingu TaxID=84603 RepID=A0A9W8JNV2_9AGAR|nr:hypothetical protein NLJ89_g11373 [Agrocybe chaxingu]
MEDSLKRKRVKEEDPSGDDALDKKLKTTSARADPWLSSPVASGSSTLAHENEPRNPSVSQPAEPDTEVFVRHHTHWIYDTSPVILQVHKTRFKVHKSRLAKDSLWFRTLFSRNYAAPGVPPEERDVLELIGNSATVVDGVELFVLDPKAKATTVEDLAELLTAMDSAIGYYETTPQFQTVKKIYRAAHLFYFPTYRKFALAILRQMFIANRGISEEPSPYCAECVAIGREYKFPVALMKCAFYDLARSPPPNPTSTLAADMKNLKIEDLVRLNNLQKHLSLVWNDISTCYETTCDVMQCQACAYTRQLPSFRGVVEEAKKAFPFDPLSAIQILVTQEMKKPCPLAAQATTQKLNGLREKIWKDMAEWLNLEE